MTVLADTTLAALRKEILSGSLPPGTKLAEAPVARRLGVSRVPVREALVILANEGLVQVKETGRCFVKGLSLGDLEELFAMRLLLEPAGARLAASRLKAYLPALRKNIRETASAGSLVEITGLDLDFHELIMEAAGNSRLLRAWRALRPELLLGLGGLQRQRDSVLRDVRPLTVKSHRELLEQLACGSPEQCELVMRQHILGWRQWMPLEAEPKSLLPNSQPSQPPAKKSRSRKSTGFGDQGRLSGRA
jgi:DNA-binding GntR family transcriptional regulator